MATYGDHPPKRCSVCGTRGPVNIFTYRCHICEQLMPYADVTWRCGYPFCPGCIVRWFGSKENLLAQHSLHPCLVCERSVDNQALFAGRFAKVHNPLYFPPVHYYSSGGPPSAGEVCLHTAFTTIPQTNARVRPTPEMNTHREDQVLFTKWPPGPEAPHCHECERPETCFECVYRSNVPALCPQCIYNNIVREYHDKPVVKA